MNEKKKDGHCDLHTSIMPTVLTKLNYHNCNTQDFQETHAWNLCGTYDANQPSTQQKDRTDRRSHIQLLMKNSKYLYKKFYTETTKENIINVKIQCPTLI